ncbi:porphyromonas-type peptidyl-arginine deiminase [Streptomyces aureoverticillatus]|nr:porphyromonas-type peptidyl-arginine deiminase [Streptomyces aureoverticillatus]
MNEPHPTRRGVLKITGAGTAALALTATACQAEAGTPGNPTRSARRRWTVPADEAPHRRTWMSWPTSDAVWGDNLAGVQRDIALLARTVAAHEPVIMCAPDRREAARARAQCGRKVTVLDSIPTDDLWMRDTCAVFRCDGAGGMDAVGLGFNGWGGKQRHRRDAQVARGVAEFTKRDFTRAGFVGEGGGIETDGAGTVMATESSLVNANRNPGKSRDRIEAEVLRAYGARKMIWAPGIKGKDITDDHIDATSRFVRPGVVMVQVPSSDRTDIWARDAREQLAILSRATDARGRRLRVIKVEGPTEIRSTAPTFLDSYLNFHVVNGAVITARFGDRRTDEGARRALAAAFPDREVIQLDVDRLMAGGGGIHCATMQEPKP